MGVIKQKNGYAFRIDVPSTTGKRTQKYMSGFSSEKEAYAAMIELQHLIHSGNFQTPSTITVTSFIEIWLEDHVTSLTPKTYRFYNNLYKNYIQNYFNDVKLADLRANHINRFYKHLSDTTTLSSNSIHHIHKTLRTSFNYAVKWDYIDQNPINKVTAPKHVKPQLKYWDHEQISNAIDRLNGNPISWHMKIALLLGLRQGEICALNESDFNFKRHVLTISNTLQYMDKGVVIKAPKTEKSARTIPLSSEVEHLVLERIKEIKENRMLYGPKYNSEWIGYLSVFENGNLITDLYVSKKWSKIMKTINIDPITGTEYNPSNPCYLPPIRFHDLRHSCASWLLFNGVNLKAIQEILGHSSFSVTSDIYAHLNQSELKAGLSTLSLKMTKTSGE